MLAMSLNNVVVCLSDRIVSLLKEVTNCDDEYVVSWGTPRPFFLWLRMLLNWSGIPVPYFIIQL